LFLLSIVWVDAKVGWTNAKGEWCYCSAADAAHPSFAIDQDMFKKTKLHFYIAVNALVGHVVLIFVTGTKGWGDWPHPRLYH
jgi:hypothetical protein